MALDIVLEDERGARIDGVGDVSNALGRLLPPVEDRSFRCLGFIDLYGDTIFNRLQMGEFLSELSRIRQQTTTAEERELLDRISDLARRCKEEPHRYLRFYGD